jgi:hypothetical protein
MNLFNIIECYRKNFPNGYKHLFSKLQEAKSPEEKARIYVNICTMGFFFIGLIYDMASYMFLESYFPAAVNMVSLLIFAASAYSYQQGKLTTYGMLALLLFTVQLNVSISIFYHFTIEEQKRDFTLYHDLFIGFLACILAALTLEKKYVHLLYTLPLSSLASALAVTSPVSLLENFPSLCLAYISPPVFVAHIRMYLWDAFRQRERLMKERQALYRFMGMNEQQWNLMIEVIQAPRGPREQTEQLFKMMQEAISNQLVIRAKRLLVSEELLGEVNEKKELCLTANEVHLCCLILEDKTVTEISHILYINESSVRANRSRIRKKLGLKKSDNLKAHLGKLVAEVKNGS